jgi:hypothetical protein
MNPRNDNRQYVRRVVLPSGKTIEVVYFEGRADARTTPGDASAPRDLHVCVACGSHLVHPTTWEESGGRHWEVVLRCPECEWTGCGVFSQSVVERFDEELDRGTEALARDLKRLMHANMEEQIDRFVQALSSDLIVPEDF